MKRKNGNVALLVIMLFFACCGATIVASVMTKTAVEVGAEQYAIQAAADREMQNDVSQLYIEAMDRGDARAESSSGIGLLSGLLIPLVLGAFYFAYMQYLKYGAEYSKQTRLAKKRPTAKARQGGGEIPRLPRLLPARQGDFARYDQIEQTPNRSEGGRNEYNY